MPARPAMAARCTSALVEPEIACSTTEALPQRGPGQDPRSAADRRPVAIRRAAAGRLGKAHAVGRYRRRRRRPRQHEAERFRHGSPWSRRCPSPCRCRRSASAGRAPVQIGLVERAGAVGGPKAPAVGTGAQARCPPWRPANIEPTLTDDRRHVGLRHPSARPGWSCRSRRSTPPRRAAAPRSSPRRPSPSGCAAASRSGTRTPHAARWWEREWQRAGDAARRGRPPRRLCGAVL